jgi:hypothetical protein
MASAEARKAAIKKATTQVRSGNGFVRRAAASGRFISQKSAAKSYKSSKK